MKKHLFSLTERFDRLSKGSLSSSLSSFFSCFQNFLYPTRCPICGSVPPVSPFHAPDSPTLICPSCYDSITFVTQPFCYSCGKPLSDNEQEFCHDCTLHPKSFSRGFSLAVYDAVTQPSLAAIKYKNKRQYMNFYVQETIKRYEDLFLQFHFDAIFPVPIHPKRRKKRGFNQAELLAEQLGNYLHLPVCNSVLIRTVNTLPLKTLSPDKRLKSLEKAFSFPPGYKDAILPYRRVLLVDDIYTTGATMEALSRLLKSHGVKEVYVFSICIGQGL